jgi:RNA polymerase sigma-70 factor (ECF subfamily)
MGIELETPVMAKEAPGATVEDPAEAFRHLSWRHVQSAYRLAWAILGDERDAQDAAQDAFTTAWRQRSTLHEIDRFDAWFGRILVNCCRDRLRRKARAPWASPLDAEPSLPDQSGAALEQHELYRQIARLGPDQRIVVILRYWKDMTVDDIAECLGVPAGTVKSRLHRSLAKLRAAMEDAR